MDEFRGAAGINFLLAPRFFFRVLQERPLAQGHGFSYPLVVGDERTRLGSAGLRLGDGRFESGPPLRVRETYREMPLAEGLP